LFDPAVNDQCGGGQDQQDGKNDQVFLVAVEKHLEGVGPLRDFGKWHWGFCGSADMVDRNRCCGRPIKAPISPKSMRKSPQTLIFAIWLHGPGDFHRHQ
jgi:hypothetical protein